MNLQPIWMQALESDSGGNELSPFMALLANEMFGMEKQKFKQEQPLRKQWLGNFDELMSGKFNPETSPMFAPSFAMGKQGIEDQYGLAKENILSTLPRGGGMSSALGDLEAARAEKAGELPAMLSQQITNDMLQKAYGSVFPGTNVNTGAAAGMMGSAANLDMQKAALDAQSQSSNMQGLGQILGLLAMFA